MRSTYTSEYKQILYAEDVWPILRDDFNSRHELLQELFNDPADIRSPFIRELQRKCDEVFRKTYTHVIAYHGCRILDPDEYLKLGLLTSSRARLEAYAKKVFAGLENLERALTEAAVYFKTYDESISMYISAEFAAADYLEKGSHYLRMVAANLRREAEERLENSRRKPYFVKCKIPIAWLEDPTIVKELLWLYKYNASLMGRFIWDKANIHEAYDEPPETLIIFKDIPPENIEAILPPGICVNWPK